MIEQELIFLGLLKESPKHGYEIKKTIKEFLSLFAGIEVQSVYYPLKVLKKKGLVTEHADKAGRRPQRFVYALTSKGESRFKELLVKSFLNFKRPHFTLDLSLYFLNYVKPSIAKRRLRGRMLILEGLSRDLKLMIDSLKKKGTLSFIRILEHNLQMVNSESQFLKHLVQTL